MNERKKETMNSANLFYELLAMFGYPPLFIINFCFKKKCQLLDCKTFSITEKLRKYFKQKFKPK